MARIRSIKPEFFKDYKLFKAERDYGMPLRLAFEALWLVADREGRFAWLPEELKVDCLPHDDIDFSRVLDALATRGFLVKYACRSGKEPVFYGLVKNFRRHQVLNNKERASEIPGPDDDACEVIDITYEPDALTTREPRDSTTDATRDVRVTQGKEGKGTRNEEGSVSSLRSDTGAEAPGSQPEDNLAIPLPLVALARDDPRSALFGNALTWLTKASGRRESQVRPMLGKWLKASGDDARAVYDIIARAQTDRVAEPISWVERTIRDRFRPPGNTEARSFTAV